MNIEEYRDYCMSKKGVTESTPFHKSPDVLVFKVQGKMFTATNLSTFDSFSIKCDPETIDELRAEFDALEEPAYFNKRHWSSVVIDGSIRDSVLHQWLDKSYELVVAKLPKKVRLGLQDDE